MKFKCENSFKEVVKGDSLSKGIGLENVKKRLDLIYPVAHTLNIEKLPSLYMSDHETEKKKTPISGIDYVANFIVPKVHFV